VSIFFPAISDDMLTSLGLEAGAGSSQEVPSRLVKIFLIICEIFLFLFFGLIVTGSIAGVLLVLIIAMGMLQQCNRASKQAIRPLTELQTVKSTGPKLNSTRTP
jgi:hypothetical protein